MNQVPGTDIPVKLHSKEYFFDRNGAKGRMCLAPLVLRFHENPLD